MGPKRFGDCNPLVRVKDKHLLEQVQTQRILRGKSLLKLDSTGSRKGFDVFSHLRNLDELKVCSVRGSEHLEDPVQLIQGVGASKNRLSLDVDRWP